MTGKKKVSLYFATSPRVVAHWRCGGSLVALQTPEAVVPGSNPASLTVENSENRQSHGVYVVHNTILGQKGKTSTRGK